MNQALDKVRDGVRAVMNVIARALNAVTRGKLSPNTVTIIGLLAHLPIAYFIAVGELPLAAVLLVIFGLFDTLDGQLARLQKREGPVGMLLDASTDRMKEVMLYTGVAFYLVSQNLGYFAVWAVVACGASLCVSYVKAKGETAIAKSNLSTTQVNRMFQDGIMRFEIRMFILFIGLLSNRLALAMVVIAILASLTALYRLIVISQKLGSS